jgi:hypothetical protein
MVQDILNVNIGLIEILFKIKCYMETNTITST